MNLKNFVAGWSFLRKGEDIPGMPCFTACVMELGFDLSLRLEEDNSTVGTIDKAYGAYLTKGRKEHRIGTYRIYKKVGFLAWVEDLIDLATGIRAQRVKRTFFGQLPGNRGNMENLCCVSGLLEDLFRILSEYEHVGAVRSKK